MSGDVQVRFCERPGVQFPRATHLVMVFEREEDARRVQAVLPTRFGKYGLHLHPDKTRLLRFEPPTRPPPSQPPPMQRGRSFDLLGMTLYWNRSRRGRWVVTQKPAKARFRRGLRRLNLWCQQHKHDPVEEQHAALSRKLHGHYAYYGVTNWSPRLRRLRELTRLCSPELTRSP